MIVIVDGGDGEIRIAHLQHRKRNRVMFQHWPWLSAVLPIGSLTHSTPILPISFPSIPFIIFYPISFTIYTSDCIETSPVLMLTTSGVEFRSPLNEGRFTASVLTAFMFMLLHTVHLCFSVCILACFVRSRLVL